MAGSKSTSKSTSPKVASPQDFKKKNSGRILSLPSGLNVKAKRTSVRAFITEGNIPNALLPIVEEALSKGQGADIAKIVGGKDGQVDLSMIEDMYDMVNQVVCAVLLEPKVHMIPSEQDRLVWNQTHPGAELDDVEDLRHDDLLYVDEMEDEDKMFLFQWASGGTDDVAKFREEAKQQLVAVEQGQGVEAAAKLPAGSGS